MPKKAVAIFFLLAFVGAALFVYFTFPRTKEQIPTSNNQRPFPSAPEPGPHGLPVPESAPSPQPTKVPPGPTLHVMAWASGAEAQKLEAEANAFGAATGRYASLTIDTDEASYRKDLQQAVANGTPPDVCLVNSRDFCGLDPAHDFADITAKADGPARSLSAFTVQEKLKAVPCEFSVEVLFYNPRHFDQAGIGYPDRHWNWDILEADARALASLRLKNDAGQPTYPLELPADFDFWNILCAQAGQAALDQDIWHLGDLETKDSQIRALDFIHEIFQELSVTPPLPKPGETVGRYFAQQRSSLLIAPSDLAITLTSFPCAFTLLPGDIQRASLARVNGWGVLAASTQTEAARALATYLAEQPLHAGWCSVKKPADENSPEAICAEALSQALVPRIDAKSGRLVQFLDHQIDQLARKMPLKSDEVYAAILAEYQSDITPPTVAVGLPQAAGQKPVPKVDAQLRGL